MRGEKHGVICEGEKHGVIREGKKHGVIREGGKGGGGAVSEAFFSGGHQLKL